jgi:hypothetical protein
MYVVHGLQLGEMKGNRGKEHESSLTLAAKYSVSYYPRWDERYGKLFESLHA